MSEAAWSTRWLETGVTHMVMRAWRGVEAQHVVSTMRLVDTAEEQSVLEQLLESSKPPLPQMASPKHYLLYAPFRYRPQHQSRFRRAGTLGVWYGAEEVYAACAEVAYWRHRFILDSAPLLHTELLTEHTFFQAEVKGAVVDLMSQPWVQARASWTYGSDYAETHAVAETAAQLCSMSTRLRCFKVLPTRPGIARRRARGSRWCIKPSGLIGPSEPRIASWSMLQSSVTEQ